MLVKVRIKDNRAESEFPSLDREWIGEVRDEDRFLFRFPYFARRGPQGWLN